MSDTPGGLPGTRHEVAQGASTSDPAPPAERLRTPKAAEDPRTLERDQSVDLPTPGQQVRPEAIYAKGQPRSPKTYAPPKRPIHAIVAPVLLSVGALLMVPAIWATLVLTGVHVWRYQAPGTHTAAGVMLICYPLASLLALAGGVYFVKQRRRR